MSNIISDDSTNALDRASFARATRRANDCVSDDYKVAGRSLC